MLKIKDLRLEHGFSQRAVAEQIQSSQKAIALWEAEKAEPTAHFIIALADCFGCSTDYLLGRSDDFGNVNVESSLTEEERALLLCFRRLNRENKSKLSDYGAYLSTK